MAMTLWEAREYFKTLNKRLNSLQGNLLNEVVDSSKELGLIGKGAAQQRIEELNRIDTGRMLNYVKNEVDVIDDNTVLVTVSDQVLDNPKSKGVDYVPFQEYGTYTTRSGQVKEPVRMMDRADLAMAQEFENVFEDTIELAWLKTIQDEELPF